MRSLILALKIRSNFINLDRIYHNCKGVLKIISDHSHEPEIIRGMFARVCLGILHSKRVQKVSLKNFSWRSEIFFNASNAQILQKNEKQITILAASQDPKLYFGPLVIDPRWQKWVRNAIYASFRTHRCIRNLTIDHLSGPKSAFEGDQFTLESQKGTKTYNFALNI